MEENRMKKHVTAVAAIRIALHTLGLIGIIIASIAVRFAFDFIPQEEIPELVMPFVQGIISFLFIVVGLISILGIIGAVGLLANKGWARILSIVVAAVCCLNIPIGTLSGVYTIWVLLQDETIVMFKKQY
ncbi:MAG: hypothetical protein R6W67_06815 [Bacteroidales bacterium]